MTERPGAERARAASPAPSRPDAPWWRRVEVFALAALSYVPFLLSSPGKVSADTKAYLYLDPGRLLARAPYLWDAHVGAGTVPHQNVGYLFPMGPYFWVMEQLQVPDWVAQRLWMGSISFAAALGALWLFSMLGTRRVGAIAGAVVFMLTPYQLAFTARISALLLPWAALPWLVGLTIRAARRGGWRDPVLFAFVVLVVGGTNASTLLFAGLGPALWLVVAVVDGRLPWRSALETVGRLAVPTVGLSMWWAAGLTVQGRDGLPVLQLTETVRTTSASSLPGDLLRGIGNWFFYGGDRLGPWLDQSSAFADSRWLIATTFAVPILALLAAAVVRWAHRSYFAVLVVVGTLVGVGAWPFDRPSVFGRVFSDFASSSSAGLALRNTARVVPIIVLGVAGLLAAGVTVVGRPRLRFAAGALVALLAIVSFAPVWEHGYLSERVQSPEDIPRYWERAAAALDREGDATRVLEVPGSDFAAYRWGNTVDPITPGLMDRPWIGRESLPSGTPGTVDLLAALDRRIQEGTFEPAALAPVARLLAAGTVLVRSDLEYERYDTPRPRAFWALLTDPIPPGLAAPTTFGPAAPNRAGPTLPMLDEIELRTSSDVPWPPEVALFAVTDPVPIVHVASSRTPVVLAGDGEGIVDAVEAGLLDGTEIVLYAASLDRTQLRDALRRDATLVVTDTNRRRARRWTALRDVTGPTEVAGREPLEVDVDDHRLPAVPDATDRSRTVAEHRGGRVDATGSGPRDRYVPEDRPVHAVDDHLGTAWKVGAGGDPVGERLIIEPDHPARADRLTLVQPQDGRTNRWITEVAVTVDGREPITVELDETSRLAAGQEIRFPAARVHRLEIEILATDLGDAGATRGASGVGFSEVRVDDVVVRERVRLPVDLLERAGSHAADRPLAIVLSRLRSDPADQDRQDEERTIARRFVLPDARSFRIGGTARVAADAPDELLDALLGTTAPGSAFTASGHLTGDPGARASRAFDGDPSTAWTAPIGTQEGQWVEVVTPAPVTIDHADLTVLADGRHSVPTTVTIEADGVPARTLEIGPVADGADEGATSAVPVSFEPVTASSFRFVVTASRPVTTTDDRSGAARVLPVGIAEIAIAGLVPPDAPDAIPTTCREDLVTVDGRAVPVRVGGAPDDGLRGFALESCDALALSPGSHEVDTISATATGIHVDRLVLRSDADGEPGTAGSVASSDPDARVRVVDSGPTSFDLEIDSDGDPFWLVLGQSRSEGWRASVDGRTLEPSQLVDGYANGWLVRPDAAGTLVVELRWTPQRIVWIGIAISVLAVLACVAVLVHTRRRRHDPVDVADTPTFASPFAFAGPARSTTGLAVAAVALGTVAALTSRPWIGGVVGVATLVAARVARGRVVLTAGAPSALAAAKAFDAPELGWVAVLLLLADVFVARVSAGPGEPEDALGDDILVDLGGAPGDRV